MTPEGIDYKAVLADMEEKRVALDAAIENMKRWLGVAATISVGPTRIDSRTASDLASDTFFADGLEDMIDSNLDLGQPSGIGIDLKSLNASGDSSKDLSG